MTPTVVYIEADGTEHVIETALGASVMETARRKGIPGIEADCGGACACATCHVYVEEDWREQAGAAGANEQEMLDCVTDFGPGSRLSCQIKMTEALDGLVVRLPLTQR